MGDDISLREIGFFRPRSEPSPPFLELGRESWFGEAWLKLLVGSAGSGFGLGILRIGWSGGKLGEGIVVEGLTRVVAVGGSVCTGLRGC
jgi:hypothetical protein